MRIITSDALAVLSGPAMGLAVLVQMSFSPAVRLASGSVAIEYGGQLYYGAGALGAVEAVRDEVASTQGLRFTLSGVPSEYIALALQDSARGVACAVRLAVLHPTTQALVDAPLLWAGTLDQMPIARGTSSSTVGVSGAHKGALLRRPKPLRYTDGDQQRLYSGDTSGRFVVSQSQKQDVWPAASFLRK